MIIWKIKYDYTHIYDIIDITNELFKLKPYDRVKTIKLGVDEIFKKSVFDI